MTAQEPPQGIPAVEINSRYFPCPADLQARKVTLGGTDYVVVHMQTQSTSMVQFWTPEAWREKVEGWMADLTGGIVPAPADALARIHQFPTRP